MRAQKLKQGSGYKITLTLNKLILLSKPSCKKKGHDKRINKRKN